MRVCIPWGLSAQGPVPLGGGGEGDGTPLFGEPDGNSTAQNCRLHFRLSSWGSFTGNLLHLFLRPKGGETRVKSPRSPTP